MRSALSFAVPRTVTAEDMDKVLERAVPRYEGRILRALVFRWMLDGEEIVEPVGSFGEILSADVEVLIER
jgi:cell division ATPase FtsA